jgi:hypothetical protein
MGMAVLIRPADDEYRDAILDVPDALIINESGQQALTPRRSAVQRTESQKVADNTT